MGDNPRVSNQTRATSTIDTTCGGGGMSYPVVTYRPLITPRVWLQK